jgi:hypothetical protein
VNVLVVQFDGREDLLAQQSHLAIGCIFVPVPEPLPEVLADLLVRLRTPTGAEAELRARVFQVVPGQGVALGFEDKAGAKRLFAEWIAEVSGISIAGRGIRVVWGEEASAPARPQPPRFVETEPEVPLPPPEETAAETEAAEAEPPPEPAPEEEQAAGPLLDQIRAMSAQQKMQLAAHGDRVHRLILVKDTNRTLQSFLLQNPHITLEEVRYLAGFRQATPDALQTIAAHREWSQNQTVVLALVRNPRTPMAAAVRLLDRVGEVELRRLARSPDVPRGVQLAARKKVNG